MRNFAYPYFSRDIAEFWRRWHISLSSWFRDYLYLALGGSRTKPWKVYRNVMVMFLVLFEWFQRARSHGLNLQAIRRTWVRFVTSAYLKLVTKMAEVDSVLAAFLDQRKITALLKNPFSARQAIKEVDEKAPERPEILEEGEGMGSGVD